MSNTTKKKIISSLNLDLKLQNDQLIQSPETFINIKQLLVSILLQLIELNNYAK